LQPDGQAPTRAEHPGGRRELLAWGPRRARFSHLWEALDPNQRLAAIAAVAICLTMVLPWYSETATIVVGSGARATLSSSQATLSAFQAFSFVEAAVLLVSAGVLVMLYARAEGQPFRLPGGDGTIVMIAGAWSALLIFYRMLEKPGLHGTHRVASSVGVEWGIFLALACALLLAVAGSRMRAQRVPDAPLLRGRARASVPETAETLLPAGARPRYPPAPSVPPVGRVRRGGRPPAPPTASTVRYPGRGA
jgi:hypothetical protein